ncbi:hypothetical protein M407DRAFT_210635 [Tulasnella calospora MUT 4182]|uniref:Uncharacterized protein n=1 Tax=Tulasnella calospora MUT 4182 TaxID=1051891 RepID=A0A0C3QHT6_9AGAM|nr:hypothetical protein M407DRAFT_210635 [Tulasnella calospora MUT 4182]
MFKLRIFCPWKCGDMPAAASAFTGGKHHGARVPCRVCPIEGIRIQNSTNLNHYLPITRPPDYPPSRFDLSTLPLRTHSQWMQQAREVDQAPTQTEQQELSRLYGINRTAITSKIPGFTFPWSVPYDFMHLLENTIKNYIGLICGDFKDLGPGVESYVLPSAIWKQIGSATAISNDTIPSAFGRRVPNVAEDRTYMTAEAHLVWATMYSRILLRGRFSQERYYIHWCQFISIIERCLDFESTSESRAQLREDIHIWYSEYERYEHHRDATFIQYKLVIDRLAHRHRKTPVFQANTYFGQLERAFVIRLEPSEALQTADVVSLILMDVNMCDTSRDRYGFWEYDKFRYREVINGTTIRALVGRMRDREKWVFVQRLGAIEHASFAI